ncbi:hypothetical protein UA08_07411 [Talaromyces atroroseus]|uniref:Ecp2 effector protein domain-containing protein n=1 Tax=Talaromyces atroroseus TaxID=1441469 RepID=A0A225AAA9_TALAT|nr:hypothetical protein UA08_07411 [Talaromyces atroroseus]OKL57070.1 hypothetical protein UA08_07411 [Talaromyces atroroseus]
MKFTAAATAASAILLSSQATALSMKRTIPSSYYSNQEITGSIYSWDTDSECNQIFYTAGSCGLSTYFTSTIPSSSGYNFVAMGSAVMSQFGSYQNNELCGKTIEITNSAGVTEQAVIADTASADIIDMCLGLWEDFGGVDGDGTQMTGMEWRLV